MPKRKTHKSKAEPAIKKHREDDEPTQPSESDGGLTVRRQDTSSARLETLFSLSVIFFLSLLPSSYIISDFIL